MPEFGADGPGFAIHDAEVDDMFGAYQGRRSAYFVVAAASASPAAGPRRRGAPAAPLAAPSVVGGGGFAPLQGGDGRTCELRKMYFLPEVRGLGLGQEVLTTCIEGARRAGYARMYLETIASMTRAIALYERNGFARLASPLGRTGHYTCTTFYVRDL
jgi:putative acetyltransferase